MRWYTASEICTILSRFEVVHIIGDSMPRRLAVGLNMLARGDLVEGPHLSARPDPEGRDCRCAGAFDSAACLFNSAFSTHFVLSEKPNAYVCSNMTPIEFSPQRAYPLSPDGLQTLNEFLPKESKPPSKPHAFVFGHGMWNDLNVTASRLWLGQLQDHIISRMPHLKSPGVSFPRLYMTPGASGVDKPRAHELTQGNQQLMRFERDMGGYVRDQGLDHLGTWNLTIQGSSPDGTHTAMRGVLIKAMMVMNWLDWVSTEQLSEGDEGQG